MKTYNVFQQKSPHAVKTAEKNEDGTSVYDYHLNLKHVGQVRAHNGSEAIDIARKEIDVFKTASRSTLGAFPIVQEW